MPPRKSESNGAIVEIILLIIILACMEHRIGATEDEKSIGMVNRLDKKHQVVWNIHRNGAPRSMHSTSILRPQMISIC